MSLNQKTKKPKPKPKIKTKTKQTKNKHKMDSTTGFQMGLSLIPVSTY